MAASNRGRLASGINPRSRNSADHGTHPLVHEQFGADQQRQCDQQADVQLHVAEERQRDGVAPGAVPSAIDNSSSGSQASATIASRRRCSRCRTSSVSRVLRQSW